jgi:hypothetical protein
MHIGTSVSDKSGKFSVEVLVRGVPQNLYAARDGYPYVVGVPGERYVLRLRNLTGGRLEIVNAIDQRDTCSNNPAGLTNRGMLLPAHGSTVFEGWRHNNDEVGEFVFGAPEHSVSAQATGDPSGVGVIAFAAFTEYRSAPSYGGGYRGAIIPEMYQGGLESRGLESYGAEVTRSAGPATLGGGTARGGLGTGIGDTVESRVQSVSFTRADGEPSILEVGYDTEQWLIEQGIIAPGRPVGFPKGQAFGAYQQVPR